MLPGLPRHGARQVFSSARCSTGELQQFSNLCSRNTGAARRKGEVGSGLVRIAFIGADAIEKYARIL
jgi:hypothetical protein